MLHRGKSNKQYQITRCLNCGDWSWIFQRFFFLFFFFFFFTPGVFLDLAPLVFWQLGGTMWKAGTVGLEAACNYNAVGIVSTSRGNNQTDFHMPTVGCWLIPRLKSRPTPAPPPSQLSLLLLRQWKPVYAGGAGHCTAALRGAFWHSAQA